MFLRLILPLVLLFLNVSALFGQIARPFALPDFPGRYQRAWTRFVGFSPKGTYVLAVVEGNPCAVSVWRGSDQTLQFTVPIRPQDGIADHSHDSIEYLAFPVWSSDEKSLFIPTHTDDAVGYEVIVTSVLGVIERRVPIKRPPRSSVVRLLTNRDGSKLAIGYNAVWNDDTQRVAVHILDGITGKAETAIDGFPEGFQLYDLDFSEDGKRVVTAGLKYHEPDRTKLSAIKIWDAENGKLIADLGARSAAAFRVKLSRDGKAMVSAHLDKRLVIWDLSNEKSPGAKQTIEFNCNNSWDYQAGYGKLLANDDLTAVGYVGDYQSVAVWRANDWVETNLNIAQARQGAALSPDGSMLVTGSDSVKTWDLGRVSNTKRVADATLELPLASSSFRFTSDEKRLVGVAWSDRKVAFSIALGRGKRLGKYDEINLGNSEIYLDSFLTIDRSVGELVFARPSFVTVNPLSGSTTTLIKKGELGEFHPKGGAISFDGKRILMYDETSWRLSDRKGEDVVWGEYGLRQAFFSDDDQRLIIQKDFSVLVLDRESGKKIDQLPIPVDHYIRMASKNPNVVFGTDYYNKSMFRLNLNNGSVDYPFDLLGQSSRLAILGYATAAKAEVIVTATSDNRVRIWDSKTGEEKESFLIEGVPCWVGVTGDAKQIYVATYQPNQTSGRLLRFSVE
ncbi:MAG: hypothetical protein ACK5YR_24445 [Pirellula sp.]|jgi:WD40 repeat protein